MKRFITRIILVVLVIAMLQIGLISAGAVTPIKTEHESLPLPLENLLEQKGYKKSVKEDGITKFEVISIKPIESIQNNDGFYAGQRESSYVKDTLTLIAFDEKEAKEIEKNLKAENNNDNFRYNYYLGASVYMSSRVYFKTRSVAGLDYPYMHITKVTAQCTVPNGTVLKNWRILIGQNGKPNGQQIYQKNLYGGPNPATVFPPSSWCEILMEPTGIHGAGATTFCDVQRAGRTYSYSLNNQIF